MSDFGDFGNMRKVFLGNTQITFLQRGDHPMYNTPVLATPRAFPAHLLTALGRAFDPYDTPSTPLVFSDDGNTRAIVGDSVFRIDNLAQYAIGSANSGVGGAANRLVCNSSAGRVGPTLVDHVGRRCLQFDPSLGNNLTRVSSPMEVKVFKAFTFAAMVYLDPADPQGTIFTVPRAEYSSGRSEIRIFVNNDGSNTYITSRVRMDSTSYPSLNYNANTAAGFNVKPGWRMVWFEYDFGKGDGDTTGFWDSTYGTYRYQTDPFVVSFGADNNDTNVNRISLGMNQSGVTPTNLFKGHIGKFFFSFRNFNEAEREELIQWLMSTPPSLEWVDPTPASTWFPYDIVNDVPSWAIDLYDPSIMVADTATGSPASNTDSVGLARAITSGLIGTSNTAVNGGPAFAQEVGNNRPQLMSSWGSTWKGDRYALVFNGANSFLQMANGVSIPSLADGSYPKTRYDYAFLRIDPGITAANDTLGIVPFQEYKSDNIANTTIKPFWLDTRVLGGRFNFNSDTTVNTFITDSRKRIPPGWVWFESITTIANNDVGGVTSQIFMNGDHWGNVSSTLVAGAIANTDTVLIGAVHNGTELENFMQASVQIGRSGMMMKSPSPEERERLFTWAKGMSYVGMPFPIDFMSDPFTAMGAAYDPYNGSSMNSSTIGNNITRWNPTFQNNIRTDGLGTVNMQANTALSPSANAPILSSNGGFVCMNHSNSRLLVANVTGMFLRSSLEFSCGGLLYTDSSSANTIQGVPWHHFRQGTGGDYNSYIGLTQTFRGSANSYPLMKARTGAQGANNIILANTPYNESQPFKHPTYPEWHAIIHTVKISANTTGSVNVDYKVWLNGVQIVNETKAMTPWLNDDLSKMTKFVIGGQLNDSGAIVPNTNWASYLGRNFWFEQAISSDADAQLLTHWLFGHGYTPIGS